MQNMNITSVVIRIKIITLFVLSAMVGLALADGMPIDKDGRFKGGPTTVVTLTAEQIKFLAGPERKWERISLSSEQRAKLMIEAGKSPEQFSFYDTRIGENDCTCAAENRALRFSESEAEIPHSYLKSGEEVEESN